MIENPTACKATTPDGTLEILGWRFPASQEIDIEVHLDGEYLCTVTLDNEGNVTHTSRKEDIP